MKMLGLRIYRSKHNGLFFWLVLLRTNSIIRNSSEWKRPGLHREKEHYDEERGKYRKGTKRKRRRRRRRKKMNIGGIRWMEAKEEKGEGRRVGIGEERTEEDDV